MSRTLALACAVGLATSALGAPHRIPDFSGLWSTASLTELERPDDFKALVATEAQAQAFEKVHRGKAPKFGSNDSSVGGAASEWWERDVGLARIRGQARTSWLVSPADGKLPTNAAAKAADKVRREHRMAEVDNPESRSTDERCLGFGAGAPLFNGGVNDNYQFVQTRDHLAIYAEWMHDVRIVRIVPRPKDERASHPAPVLRVLSGDSVGWWDGDTLVIESTNFSPYDVDAPGRDPAADMRVVERLTRLASGELLYAFAVTSPSRFTQTWRGEMLLHSTKGPIYEFACHEGNYGLHNMLAGARRLEGKTVEGVAAGR